MGPLKKSHALLSAMIFTFVFLPKANAQVIHSLSDLENAAKGTYAKMPHTFDDALSEGSDFINMHVPYGRKITKGFKEAKNNVLSWKIFRTKRKYLSSSKLKEILSQITNSNTMTNKGLNNYIPQHPSYWKFEEINEPLNKLNVPFLIEGAWHPILTDPAKPDQKLVWYSRVNIDSNSDYVEIFAYDLSKVTLGYCSDNTETTYMTASNNGFNFPARKNTGCSKIPHNIVQSNSLVAAFRGGFRLDDGLSPDHKTFGVISDGQVNVPPSSDLMGLGVLTDNAVVLETYGVWRRYLHYRQNGAPILLGGQVTENAKREHIFYDDGDGQNASTNRQAVGMGDDKRWLYVARSNDINNEELANALRIAGAQNGMLLDENSQGLTTHVVYQYGSDNKVTPYFGYDTKPTGSLDPSNPRYNSFKIRESQNEHRFKDEDEGRDFFYVYQRK